jgi:hypothetical protein
VSARGFCVAAYSDAVLLLYLMRVLVDAESERANEQASEPCRRIVDGWEWDGVGWTMQAGARSRRKLKDREQRARPYCRATVEQSRAEQSRGPEVKRRPGSL